MMFSVSGLEVVRWAGGTVVALTFIASVSMVRVTETHTRDPAPSLSDVRTVSCKTATTTDATIQCCAEAHSDSVHLTSHPLTRLGGDAEVWYEHPADSFSDPDPVPRDKGKSHVLVTGGAGYIGSHATLQLLEEGHAVTIVDNLSRGNAGAIEALKRVAQPQQLRFVLLDLGNLNQVIKLFSTSKFDVVIHFAALAYVAESYTNPLLYYKNVTTNTQHVLEGMRAGKVNRLVYSSTCATYGNPDQMPITENTPQRPVSPYGSTKLASEQMIKDFVGANKNFGAVILRYFNVIGADPLGRIGEYPTAKVAIHHGRISGACFNAALGKTESLTIMGTDHDTTDGTAVRDYIHVVDLVSAHVNALGAFHPSKAQVYNVGIGKGYSVRQFVDACIRVTGVNVSVVERARRPGDASIVYADPRKVMKELKWKPRFTDLEESLRTAWNWTFKHPGGYRKEM